MMQRLHQEGAAKEMSEVALAPFYQLREPGMPCPGDLNFEDAEEEAKRRHVMDKIRAIFALPPLPKDESDADGRFRKAAPPPSDENDEDDAAESEEADGEEAPEQDATAEEGNPETDPATGNPKNGGIS